jgi:hypothetical protein
MGLFLSGGDRVGNESSAYGASLWALIFGKILRILNRAIMRNGA